MRNFITFFGAALIGAAALLSCTRLEVTLPKGPQGEQGIQGIAGLDGLSSYEVWVKAVADGTIPGWDKTKTGIFDYLIYIKGEKGDRGEKGESAYEIWKEYVATGEVDDPRGGGKWDPGDDSEKDFFKFLTGPKGDDGLIPYIGDNGNWFIGDVDSGVPATGPSGASGADGLSAYKVWVDYIRDGGDPGWSSSDTTMCFFFMYLKGEKGDKGDKGDSGENGSTPFVGDDGNWHVGDTDTGVPATGPSGEDGLSAYELWKGEVLSAEGLVNPGNGVYDAREYPVWPKDAVSIGDFFLYLGGEDGADGLSAYELWKEYISGGNVDDPKNPGKKWDKRKNSEADFYYYLTGADGADGLSAYELWKRDVVSDSGLANPGNGVFDVEEYPLWPDTAVGLNDFWRYLKGRDGIDGQSSGNGLSLADTAYLERVDSKMYNVASVIALGKTSGGKTEYEYVNPISGGAAFIVTGPGPVIIPDCEVTFTDLSGTRTYTKTSNSQGYVYLTRDELPEWADGLPSAKDDPDNIHSGVRPLSFSYGSVKVTDKSKIAATCKVPYRVGLSIVSNSASLRYYATHADYSVYRIVEGETESERFITALGRTSSPVNKSYTQDVLGYWPRVNSSVFTYYRNKGVDILFSRVKSGSAVGGDLSSLEEDDLGDWFSDLNHLCGERSYEYTLHRAKVSRGRELNGSESWFNVSYGDGASPSVVGVYDLMLKPAGGAMFSGAGSVMPDYGLEITDTVREIMNPPYFSMPRDVTGSFVWDSGHTTLELSFSEEALSALKTTTVYEPGGNWSRDGKRFSFSTTKFGTRFKGPSSSFSVSGKYNGTNVNSSVSFNLFGSLKLTDVYDGFKMSVADFVDGAIMVGGFSGTFSYNRGDENAYAFGSAIEATERNVTDGAGEGAE
ncbi:MAG: hypothetical protein IJ840_07090 [Bacteroidales bacterium]|nr:hypothetical protein [Bacteroidales bacterium]